MKKSMIYRSFGVLSFVVALVVYLMTVQPTVPFWDCGEFSAASIWQQVPHPPGAPLFLMVGKIFHLLFGFGDPGWAVNLAAVFSSAFTVWLIYLITVKIILNFRQSPVESIYDELMIAGSALVGSLALTFSDTFWFNAVESEVYATSSLFVALVVYLMMRWNEEADNPGHERYILLIAYLIGLSTGVHLLAVLTVFSIVMLVYFRKYEFNAKSFILMGIIAIVIFFVIYPGIVKWIPTMLNGNLPNKNDCREYIVEGSLFVQLLTVGGIIAMGVGLWYGRKSKNQMLSLVTSAFLLMIIGYTTYTQILLRSNANPPMNENEPKTLHSLISYLGREQYGDAPNWPRRYHQDDYYTSRYNKKDANGEFVYGAWNSPGRKPVQCKTTSTYVEDWNNVNTAGELTFFWKYQIDHMYIRYFMWNFAGRTSDLQDGGWTSFRESNSEIINHKSGYEDIFPVRFWGLPLLFGLIGLFFHFWKDPKMALVYFVMFLLMGVLATIQQNQQEPQPRERDYFYAGSFMVYCIWIALGAFSIMDWMRSKKVSQAIAVSFVAVAIFAVPINMAVGGWKLHSRAGNYLPFDYSYNILQSVDKNAIIFTNGDNDTFPLWWLQDVAGVRRDVRIVNLSLGNTLWYVHQLKNRQPWGSDLIPLSFANETLDVDENDPRALSYELGEEKAVTIPVKKDILAQYTDDQSIINKGAVTMMMSGKPYRQQEDRLLYLFRVQDKVVEEILRQVRWERPVYFSTTVGPDAFCGLEKYFRYEGMAMRICPTVQQVGRDQAIDMDIMKKCLFNVDNTNEYHKEPHLGFKFRNLGQDGEVYYDEVHRRLMHNYRSMYTTMSTYALMNMNDPDFAAAILDSMNKFISPKQFPLDFDREYRVAMYYERAGAKEQARQWSEMAIKSAEAIINNHSLSPNDIRNELTGAGQGPHRIASLLYEELGDFEAARNVIHALIGKAEAALNQSMRDPSMQEQISRIQYGLVDARTRIDELNISELISKGKKEQALKQAEELFQKYSSSKDRLENYMARYFNEKIIELKAELNISDSIAAN